VSLEDHIETIKEFQDSPCPGTRQQQQDEEDVYNEAMESHAKAFPIVFHIMDNEEKAALEEALSRHADDYECYCDHKWDDDIMRKHEKHSCYLDKSHPGGHICGFCIEGYDALEEDDELREAQNYLASEPLPEHLKKHVVDDGGEVPPKVCLQESPPCDTCSEPLCIHSKRQVVDEEDALVERDCNAPSDPSTKPSADNNLPVFPSPFYHGPDFDKKED